MSQDIRTDLAKKLFDVDITAISEPETPTGDIREKLREKLFAKPKSDSESVAAEAQNEEALKRFHQGRDGAEPASGAD